MAIKSSHPATTYDTLTNKGYVDDSISSVNSNINDL
jgi:hypothetical protein